MMNRSSSSNLPDPYVPPPPSSSSSMIMPRDSGQNIQAHQQNQQQQQQQQQQVLEYWDHSAQQNQNPINYNFEPAQPPLLLPMNYTNNNNSSSFQFYEQYQHHPTAMNMIKRKDQAGRRIGLNLGHRTYFSSAVDALAIDRLLSARAQQQQQQPRCQAEGCKADLSGAKHYHRRHKVCEFHSKATVVIAGGMQQRFCQQCSRFHVRGEFDESKRSCRKRLAEHNRRRRKAQNPNNYTDEVATATRPTSSETSADQYTTSRSTATTTISTAISSDNGGGFEGGQGTQKKLAVALGSEPPAEAALLSLGGRGVDNREGMGPRSDHNQSRLYQHQQQQQHFSSTPTSNNGSSSSSYFYHHQRIFGSSSNDASQSTTERGANSDQHQQQGNNQLLHLGHAMFQVDFI